MLNSSYLINYCGSFVCFALHCRYNTIERHGKNNTLRKLILPSTAGRKIVPRVPSRIFQRRILGVCYSGYGRLSYLNFFIVSFHSCQRVVRFFSFRWRLRDQSTLVTGSGQHDVPLTRAKSYVTRV